MAKPKTKKTTPAKKSKKKEPKLDYKMYISRISFPTTWHPAKKKLADESKCPMSRIYQIALRQYLLSKNVLPENNKKSK